MCRNVGLHRPDDREVIDMSCDCRKNFADLDARLTIPGKLESRCHSDTVLTRQSLAVILRQLRFWVPRVHVRRRAGCKNVDDTFRFRWKVSFACLSDQTIVKEARKRDGSEAHA